MEPPMHRDWKRPPRSGRPPRPRSFADENQTADERPGSEPAAFEFSHPVLTREVWGLGARDIERAEREARSAEVSLGGVGGRSPLTASSARSAKRGAPSADRDGLRARQRHAQRTMVKSF